MKKLLLVLAIGAFAACGESATENESVDSSTSTVDSSTVAPTDTTATMPADSSAAAPADSAASK